MPGSKKPATLNRRSFLATGALAAPLAASAFAASAPAAPRGNKRNVLFLCCDDLTPRIGSFGDPVAKTPNLDRLSALGVRFERNYCQYPLCGPSRDSLMTGLAPDTTRIYDLNTDFRDIHPNAVTLPQLFHRNGYFTARAGKIYHYNNPSEIGTPGFDDAASWEVSTFPAGFDRTHDEGLVNIYVSASTITQARKGAEESQTPSAAQAPGTPSFQHGGRGPGGARLAQDGRTPILPLGMHGDLGIPIAAHPSEAPDELITDYMIAESAIAMIEEQHGEHPDQPWFIAAGFFRPHVPFIVPSKYFDLYALEDMQPPAVAPGELSQAPPLAYLTTEANYGLTDQQHREAMRGHFAAISFVDAQVGRLLDAVVRLGLLENTTIVFWSDHGFMVGEHGQWEKRMLFEASAHTPLIIAGAGVTAKGKACRNTSEHLNIYPTLAEICGLDVHDRNLQGHSMAPLLVDPDSHWEHPALTQVSRSAEGKPLMGYSLRTPRHRYTTWGPDAQHGEELYDYQADPGERKNLAADPASAGLKAQLREQLERIRAQRTRV